MGIIERKEREKQEMRDLILKEATRMFIEEGYEKASIRNIADRIEYSPATIYLYFKDKDELFFAIHEQGFAKLFKSFEEISPKLNPYERLVQIGNIYLQFAFDNPEYYNLMFIMRAPMKKLAEGEQWNCGFKTFNFLRNTIQECIEGKFLKPMDVDVASFSIWSLAHGMVSLEIRERFKMYSAEEVKQLMEASTRMMLGLMSSP